MRNSWRLRMQRGLYLASAPCSLLSETAQTVWKAIKDGAVGKVRLVYANFDDGMIAPNLAPWTWTNDCGVPWPAKDEFEIGCTYIHAGYVLTWLAAFFGPAKTVTSFSSCQIPDKGISVDGMAPDFSVGCIEYDDGIVARVTCGLVAPRDKSLTIIGDEGIIYTDTSVTMQAPVYVQHIPTRGRLERHRAADESASGNGCSRICRSALGVGEEWHFKRKYPFARKPSGGSRRRSVNPSISTAAPLNWPKQFARSGRAGFPANWACTSWKLWKPFSIRNGSAASARSTPRSIRSSRFRGAHSTRCESPSLCLATMQVAGSRPLCEALRSRPIRHTK